MGPVVAAVAEPNLSDFQATFRSLDRDADGGVTLQELSVGLRQLRLATDRAEARALFQEADSDGDGRISLPEFVGFCRRRAERLREIYDGVNTAGDGRLTSAEMRRGVDAAGLKISDAELRALFERVDRDADGVVTFEEWLQVLVLLPQINPHAVFERFQHLAPVEHAEAQYSPPRDVHEACDACGRPSWRQVAAKLLAGAVAGAVSRSATAPLDRVKMLLQASPVDRAPQGFLDGIASIYREGGLRAFFRGNGANVVKVAPETAVKFASFDLFKSLIARDPGNVTTGERFVAGALAGGTAQFAIYPLEVVKTRMGVSAPGTYRSMGDCLMQVRQEAGIPGLYRGLGASIAGILPYAGVDLMVNSVLKEAWGNRCAQRGEEPGVTSLLACGMVSSTAAMFLTYPVNLVRTRLQASGMPGSPTYSGAADVLRRTWAAGGGPLGGLRGLYRGILPNLLKVLPATSVSYAVYDLLKDR